MLATSAVTHGLFHGNPWSLGISGGFASPLAAELLQGADLIVGWGCALNMWTMRHGNLIGADATVVQVDDETSALGAHRPVHLGVTGDVGLTARQVFAAGTDSGRGIGPRRSVRPSPLGCGCVTCRTRTGARGSGSIRGRSASRSTTFCPPSGWSAWTPATSWATRARTGRCPTRRASASRRPSSRSGSGWRPRSGRRWHSRTDCPWRRSATGVR
ncbi:hypothetical protein WKI71_03710 [Streptomyces sp. MS1.AVA.1]|uniref:Thiamine pyrophosphate enzyme central domain-containing protein n=1 Tax=Streptomyces machairae TaxID=3134109 RepID=A0ABU8UHL7_9ACTN